MQRHLLGVTGLLFLVAGAWSYINSQGTVGATSNEFIQGVGIRVGLMLLSIWLAYPQLTSFNNRLSWLFIAVLFAMLIVIAIKPRMFPIAAVLAVVCLMVNGGLRRLIRASRDDRIRRDGRTTRGNRTPRENSKD